ncbi:hypothetical protein CCR75_009317 [Bremia lactucae]|uniref:FYVE-type domain-containing protein n=1 Tax=Bremia lactucae TaxID=4779 RepID=A0A976IMD4_BRELC|nr:hypothetical protein CCR75_009317 [Bremia lactucae]
MRLVHLLPVPTISSQDCSMLQALADTLTEHNISQYNNLVVTKDGRANPQRWREVRRQGNVRIYSERPSTSPQGSATPQLLLLGTIEGKLDEVMYGTVATTDEAMKIQTACTKNSVRDSKVLREIVHPNFHNPFRTVAVKWRLYEGCDYVSLDATGITQVRGCERIGYSITHSVALSEIPSFDETHGIERGNMSVCALYRQKTPTIVECYVRGYFDFTTKNEVLKNMSLQTIATQWSAYARKNTCAQAKKLSWKVRKDCGWTCQSSRPYSFVNEFDSFVARTRRLRPAISSEPTCCVVCHKTSSFIMSIRRTCTSCKLPVCSKCVVKKTVVALAPDKHSVLEKRRVFCVSCITAVESCDVMPIAREELVDVRKAKDDVDVYWNRLSSVTVNSSCYSSVLSQRSSLSSLSSSFNRRTLVDRDGSDFIRMDSV